MRKKPFADVEVNEKEREKFFAERRDFIRNDNNPDQSPEEKADREHMFDKLAELANVVQDVKKKHRKKK
jgi:hypothetical protein